MEPKGDEVASVLLHKRPCHLDHLAEDHAVLRKRHRGPHRVDAHELPAAASFTTTPTADRPLQVFFVAESATQPASGFRLV